jgi:signal transduction histidine kinase
VASILYLAVLAAGGYFQLAGLTSSSPARLAGFVVILVVLLALEIGERRLFRAETPRPVAIALLAVRSVLYLLVSTLDSSGFARALILLIPFAAYFTLGAVAGHGLAAACLGLVLLAQPAGWYRDEEALSDLLMFGIGLVFAISMAAVATQAQAARRRAEGLLGDLEDSHRRLAAYAEQAATLAAADERNRLARDIHNSLGHHLTAVSVQLEKAAAFRDRDPAVAGRALADARRSARDALEDVRHSVGSLRDGTFSLRAALTDLVRAGGDPMVTLELDGDDESLVAPARLALYRVAQEGLTNARRHASAGRVTVRLSLEGPTVRLLVADDGCGFCVEQAGSGYGLRGMRERLALVGGTLRVDSAPAGGTRIEAIVPRVRSIVDGLA